MLQIETVGRPIPHCTDGDGPALRLDLLGSPEIRVGGRFLRFRTRKTLTLLAYLAVQGGQHPRELLSDLFWPESDIDDARASLRTTLTYLRQALGPEAETTLRTTRDSLGLQDSVLLETDTRHLADMLHLLRQMQGIGRVLPVETRRRIEIDVERYRGQFLDGISLPDAPDLEAWVEGQRTHWRGIEEELLDRLAKAQIQDGDMAAGLATLERWTRLDPDEELAWQRLIDVHLQMSDRAGARRAWRRYREAVAELDAEPSDAMTALAAGLDEPEAPARSIAHTCEIGSPDLEQGSFPLVGRLRELSLLRSALGRSRTGRTEVAIVSGRAGVGKTRLVSQFLLEARALGADILMGSAFETIDELPFAALTDALRTRLDAENAPEDLLDDIWLAELSRLMPELRERYPDLPAHVDDPVLARSRLFEAVARLGQALARRIPLVLFLDDVQWSDSATRDALHYAIRRWATCGTPALVVLATRDDLTSERLLTQWLGGLTREAPVLSLQLTPLQQGDVVQLVKTEVALDTRPDHVGGRALHIPNRPAFFPSIQGAVHLAARTA